MRAVPGKKKQRTPGPPAFEETNPAHNQRETEMSLYSGESQIIPEPGSSLIAVL